MQTRKKETLELKKKGKKQKKKKKKKPRKKKQTPTTKRNISIFYLVVSKERGEGDASIQESY